MKVSEELVARRNVEAFAKRELDADDLLSILESALKTIDSDRNTLNLYVTAERTKLDKLADIRDQGAENLRLAPVAIALATDKLYDGSWAENAAMAAWAMCVRAVELGMVYNIVQVRGYSLSDGTLSGDVVCGILDIPDTEMVYAVVAFGYPAAPLAEASVEKSLDYSRIHLDKE